MQRVAEGRDVQIGDVGEREAFRVRLACAGSHPADDLERLAVAHEIEPVVGDRVVPLVLFTPGSFHAAAYV